MSQLDFEITVPPAQRRWGRVPSPQSLARAPALLRASCPHSPYSSPPAGSSLLPARCAPPVSLFICRTIRGLSPSMPQSLPAGCCHPQERTPSPSPIGPPRSPLGGPSAVTPSLPLWVPLENQCALRSAHLPFPIPVLAQCITSKRAGLPQKDPQLDI